MFAWLVLLAIVAGGGLYAVWPQVAAPLAGLTGTAQPAGDPDLPTVEVAPRPNLPAARETPDAGPSAAPGPDGSDAAGPADDLRLGAPQATPMRQAPPLTEPDAAEPTTAGETPGEGAGAEGSAPQVAALPQAPPPAPPPPEVPAWQRFASPYAAPAGRPLVAIVLTGLGLNGPRTLQAIEALPPEVSLSFSPYGKQTEEFMRTARAFGHEVLLDLPMEPASADDPGTLAMLTSLAPDDNLERLDIVLTRGRGYVGVVGALGARFVGDPAALEPVLAALKRRGLLYLDNRPIDEPRAARLAGELGVPVAINDRSLDARMAATPAVDASLARIERIARERGTAVALGEPNPSTIERLREWVDTLPAKGLALAPITAVVNTQPVR